MTNIISLDPAQNIYANNAEFKLVKQDDVFFEGRTIQKLTYRDSHSLIWKIGHVVLAVLVTLATLGLACCYQKGKIWKDTCALFKNHTVYQSPPELISEPLSNTNLVGQSANKPLLNANLSPAEKKIKELLLANPEFGPALGAWEKEGISLAKQAARLEDLRKYAFGTDRWNTYFGKIVGDIPPLPEDIYQICNSIDHSNGKKIKETHVLVLVPTAVEVKGKHVDITLKNLGELVKAPDNNGSSTQYADHISKIEDLRDIPNAKSHWVLMKKELLPNSDKTKDFEELVDLVEEYSKQANAEYSIPNAIDVVACCFLHYVNTGNRLFDAGQHYYPTIYTRCQEFSKNIYRVFVGCYSPSGLEILTLHPNNDNGGSVAVRTF